MAAGWGGAEDVEGELAGAGFVAAEFVRVDADVVGEGGLCETAFASEAGEPHDHRVH